MQFNFVSNLASKGDGVLREDQMVQSLGNQSPSMYGNQPINDQKTLNFLKKNEQYLNQKVQKA